METVAANRFIYTFLLATWVSLLFTKESIAQNPPNATTVDADFNTTSAKLKGSVDAKGRATIVRFQYGRTTAYRDSVDASPSPISDNGSQDVSADIQGLTPKTFYHFRVVAYNSANRSLYDAGDDKEFKTRGSPDVTSVPATQVAAISAKLVARVNPNGKDTKVKFEYGTSNSVPYQSVVELLRTFDKQQEVTVDTMVTGLDANTTYYFRAVATNAEGTVNSDNQCFQTLPFPSQLITLSHTVNFPSQPAQSDYKIIGVPGANNSLSIKSFLSGAQGKDWDLYRDDGADDFIKFRDNDPLFNLGGGRAFWVISKRNLAITATSSAAMPDAGATSITLNNKGWNLITNPFDFNIAWQTIQNANSPKQPLYTYDKGLKTSQCFEPYVGYYFYNFGEAGALLKIPYVPNCSNCPATDVQTIWRVKVLLTSGEFSDHANSFGVASEASQALDPLDWRKPRALAEMPTVSFSRPAWDAQFSIFATDIRPEFEESQSWDFDVRALPGVASQLAFTGLAKVPQHFDIFLINESKARAMNLREDSLYQFTPVAAMNKFTVVVGEKEAIKDKLSALALPQTFTLGPNYPNPFNPETTIPITIATASAVKLQIYNALGQTVKTLHDGALEAGKYWFTWNGRDEADREVATGVYLYHLRTNTNVSLTQKMILLR